MYRKTIKKNQRNNHSIESYLPDFHSVRHSEPKHLAVPAEPLRQFRRCFINNKEVVGSWFGRVLLVICYREECLEVGEASSSTI
jgi:hypothetical protein